MIRALRSSEWLLIVYFGYVALISPAFPLQPRVALLPFALVLLVSALFVVLAYAEAHGHRKFFSITRDWVPVALTLVAYREMDWFSPAARDYHLELRWVEWDRILLYRAGLQQAIESLGVLVPAYLELCYLLVYAVGTFAVAVSVLPKPAGASESRRVCVSSRHAAVLCVVPLLSLRPSPGSFRWVGHAARRDARCGGLICGLLAAMEYTPASSRARTCRRRFPRLGVCWRICRKEDGSVG